jgi:hypothetical protein
MEVKKKMREECYSGQPHHEWKHGHKRGHGHRHGFGRRFFTKAEKVEKLKSYAEELRKELKAVEEHIKELQS